MKISAMGITIQGAEIIIIEMTRIIHSFLLFIISPLVFYLLLEVFAT